MTSDFKLWKASDKAFAQVAMRFFGVSKLGLDESSSQARHPDIWLRMQKGMPVITVTAEWARQNRSEREKRITHELVGHYVFGWPHNEYLDTLGFTSLPETDSISKKVYNDLRRGYVKPANQYLAEAAYGLG